MGIEVEFKQSNRNIRDQPTVRRPAFKSDIPTGFRTAATNSPSQATPPQTPAPTESEHAAPQALKARPLSKLHHFFVAQKFMIILGSLLALAGTFIVGSIIQNSAATNGLNPGYSTVLPASKSAAQLGGWKRISPQGKDPVFAFADTIDSVAISVSEQPLPPAFKTNTEDQLADLAKKFNATTKLNAGGTKVYLGTSAKGPQSVILSKKDLLILIKSQKKIDDKAWTSYISSLN